MGSTALEKLLCNPLQTGSLEDLVPRVHDSWNVEFPGLAALPRFDGETRRLRVCIATEDIVGPVRNGGIGTTYSYLAQLLAQIGYDTTILYLKGQECENGTIEEWVEYYAQRGVTFVPVPNYGGIERIQTSADRWLLAPYNMMRYLLDHPMDVVHVSEWRGSGYLSLLAKRQGIAFQDTLFIVKTSSPWLWNRLYGSQPLDRLDDLAKTTAERRSVEYADMVIGGSLHLLRWMGSQGYRIPRSHTFVQPNVVSFDHLRDLMAERPVTPGMRLPIDEIVFFGRLESRKGLFTFVQAIKRIIRSGGRLPPRISFMGKPGARLTARPNQDILDYIRSETADWPVEVQILTEFQQYDAIRYLLSGDRLAVMPSMIENSSLAVYEAAICGIPFVASDSGGTPELIAAEDHGFVLCDSHPIPLAEKISEAVRLGGYVARPSFHNDDVLGEWRQFHLDLSRGLKEHLLKRAPPPVLHEAATSACLYHVSGDAELRQTLDSLAAQGHLPAEVLVAVDGDDPDGVSQVERMGAEYPFSVRAIEAFDLDSGPAFNLLAGQASGEFLLFLWAGSTLRAEGLTALSGIAQASGADVVNYFYRVAHGPEKADRDYLSAIVLGSVTEAFFRTDLTALPLFVRASAFAVTGGFSTDYRVLGQDYEFVANAQINGLHCETALVELGTVPAWNEEWLYQRCYDEPVSQFRAIRPQLASVPLALRELLLMSKGLQARPGGGGRAKPGRSAPARASAGPAAKGTFSRMFSAFMGDVADAAEPQAAPPSSPNRTVRNIGEQMARSRLDPEGRFSGAVLTARKGELLGLIVDEQQPARPVELEVLINNKPVSRIKANADLPTALNLPKALQRHGFVLPVFSSRFPLGLQRRGKSVSFRIAGTDIAFPASLVAPPDRPLQSFGIEGYCDPSQSGVVRGWAWMPKQPDAVVDVSIFIDGRFLARIPADAERLDLRDNGIGSGAYGFSITVPKVLREGPAKTVEVVSSETGLLLKRGWLLLEGNSVQFAKASRDARIGAGASFKRKLPARGPAVN
ncbi:glycosyltransferase [Faunimonas pinastri]|uniref:glycosyltransferase n=1 Tax=Faunimonas pinastri TaxID=1855383 RepID=UPI0015A58088|nr:glycosyltransferase [Faunimonas pinastri]